MPAYIQAHNVRLTFRPPNRAAVTALDAFDMDVEDGEFLSIVGPSGCGKSTFLNVLLGLIKPDSGEVRMHGKKITGPGSDRGAIISSARRRSFCCGLRPFSPMRATWPISSVTSRRSPRVIGDFPSRPLS